MTVAMRQFKDAGYVSCSRGQISIADRNGLHDKSRACFDIIAETHRLEGLENGGGPR